jgi:hypothetical protein
MLCDSTVPLYLVLSSSILRVLLLKQCFKRINKMCLYIYHKTRFMFYKHVEQRLRDKAINFAIDCCIWLSVLFDYF